jgi:AcrR family transcriptional regulator
MTKSIGQDPGPTSVQRGASTRTAITDAAIALIGEVGWGQVTTRAIAARAQVPHGAIGYHFAGKADLLRGAAVEATMRVLAEPLALARQAAGVRELLDGTFGWYASGGLSDPSVALLLETVRQAGRDELLREPIAAELRRYRQALAELVATDQQRGAIRPADPAGVAALLAALLDGLLLHLVLDPALDLQALAAAAYSLLETTHDNA